VFIPIKDDQPTSRTSHLTIALIFVNTAVFLYSQSLGGQGFSALMVALGFTPHYYLDLGSNYIVPSWYYLTPVTSMFLHGGWGHLIGNMLFLWIYGNNIEDYLGRVKFVLFYLISGLAAITLYTLFSPGSEVPLVGASGAIAGVMGAYMVLHPKAQITVLILFIFIVIRQFPAKVVLGIWFGYQILMSLLGSSTGGGVAWMAHVGGFIFGFLVMKGILLLRGNPPRAHRLRW
jgi:membrane associated rhomboid family serine protease